MAEDIQRAFVVAGGLLEKDGKFLLVKAKVGVPKGLWNIPAGRLEEGETMEEGAVREVREETGFDVKVACLAGVYQRLKNRFSPENMIRVNFRMEVTGGSLAVPEDEIEEARWFSLEEIRKTGDGAFAFGVKECILDYAERGCMEQRVFSTRKDVR